MKPLQEKDKKFTISVSIEKLVRKVILMKNNHVKLSFMINNVNLITFNNVEKGEKIKFSN